MTRIRKARPQSCGRTSGPAAQFQVVLAFSAHREAREKGFPRDASEPAPLEDMAPTHTEMLCMGRAGRVDGISLAAVLAGERDDGRLAGDLNSEWIATQAADHVRVKPQTGHLELWRSRNPKGNSMKHRAGTRGNQLLAALLNAAGGLTYVRVDRGGGRARRVDSLDDDVALAPMWAAMVERFAGGLTPLAGTRNVGAE